MSHKTEASVNPFITAMDKAPLEVCLGENGHPAHQWSTDLKENMAQLFFQLVRQNTNDPNETPHVIVKFNTILKSIMTYSKNDVSLVKQYEDMCGRMIINTRDIISGKGECYLTYHMLLSLAYMEYDYKTAHPITNQILYFMVNELPIEDGQVSKHPYGSWKDIKRFMAFVKMSRKKADNGDKVNICNNLLSYCVNLYIIQIKKDMGSYISKNYSAISLCCKWIPRERSKYSWIFVRLARTLFNFDDDITSITVKNMRMNNKRLRKIISQLNKVVDTVEIKQCAGRFSEINYSKVPSIAMTRQRKAFLNLDKNDVVRSNDEDRVTGAKQFVEYITSLKDGKTKVNAKRNNIVDLVSAAAFGLVSDDEHLLLDAQWNSYIDTIGNLPDMVAMVDVSGSMSGDPMMAAIGLGLCVANKSKLGRRVLTFSEEPNWINLDDCGDSFVSMVSKIINGTVGFNTNFYQALNMILDRIVQHKMTPEQVGSMVLVVFSDMQIDSANKSSIPIDTIMNQIRKLYSVSGIKICGVPYNPPHILFWNLRSTDNFPTLSSTNNTTMLSGYSPQLLNTFIKEGIDGLKKMTPYKMMECVFQNARYDIDTFGEANTEWQQACQHSTNYSDRKYIKDNALFFK